MGTRAGLLLVFILASLSCSKKTDPIRDKVVYSVNGVNLTAGNFGKSLAKSLKNFDALAAKDPTNIKRARDIILKEFLVATLIQQFANQKGLSVSPQETDEEFDRIRKSYPDDFAFKSGLASEGVSVDEFKTSISKRLLEKKVFDLLTPDAASSSEVEEEAKRDYTAHKEEFDVPAEAHILQIVLPKEDDAERLLQKLKAGASFSEVAKKFSISPDSKKGGDIGYISKGSVPVFDAAFNLKVGQLSPVIKSTYGFHIMKVLDKRPQGHLSFEKAKPRLVRKALARRQQLAFTKWLESAVKSAKIERNDALLEKIKVRTEGENE